MNKTKLIKMYGQKCKEKLQKNQGFFWCKFSKYILDKLQRMHDILLLINENVITILYNTFECNENEWEHTNY